MLMHHLLIDGAARQPDKTALRWVDRGLALTFAEAVDAMERCAGALNHLGVRKGDRVSIVAHNGMAAAARCRRRRARLSRASETVRRE